MGTPGYMAPEQILAGAIDTRTDLYAVGVMLFELLTGEPPFPGANPFSVAQAHVSAPVPRLPSSVAPALDAVVARALAKRPDDRFASAEEMRAALRAAASAPPRKRRLVLGGVAALLGAGGIAAALPLEARALEDTRTLRAVSRIGCSPRRSGCWEGASRAPRRSATPARSNKRTSS